VYGIDASDAGRVEKQLRLFMEARGRNAASGLAGLKATQPRASADRRASRGPIFLTAAAPVVPCFARRRTSSSGDERDVGPRKAACTLKTRAPRCSFLWVQT